MNCGHFQKNLYDYLDDALSRSEKSAAEEHLHRCTVCHQAVQRELLFARTVSTRLEQAVESTALDANARRRIARAVQRKTAESHHHATESFWLRLALPFAAAAVILINGIWIGHQISSAFTAHRHAPGSLAGSDRVVPVHVLFSEPAYTFHKEGILVIDALTDETRSGDGALLAER